MLIPGLFEANSQGIQSIKGLKSITIYEATNGVFSHTFDKNSSALNYRIPGQLSPTVNDFQGWVSQEFYDVFYSDADGSFNKNGKFISIEAIFNIAYTGGGLNISGVLLNFEDGRSIFLDHLEGFVKNSERYVPESEKRAVDGNIGTYTSMGNTKKFEGRLRITLGLKSFIQKVYHAE